MQTDNLFLLNGAHRRDPAVEAWFDDLSPLRLMTRPWFERLRGCGNDVRECIHDHQPTACIGEAAFAYVGAYTAHASIGFFQGTSLPDPAGLLQGSGKRMRHVKLRWGEPVDEAAVAALIDAAYADMTARVSAVDR